jgi:CheY-like chemotaxis protein
VTDSDPVRRITVIDDSPEFLEVIGELLTGAGYAVNAFDGRQLSIETLLRTRPDLVLLDLRLLPGSAQLTGWDFLLLLRAHRELRQVPIIVCSADLAQIREREPELRQIALTWVLPKPFDLQELEEIIDKALGDRPSDADDPAT